MGKEGNYFKAGWCDNTHNKQIIQIMPKPVYLVITKIYKQRYFSHLLLFKTHIFHLEVQVGCNKNIIIACASKAKANF